MFTVSIGIRSSPVGERNVPDAGKLMAGSMSGKMNAFLNSACRGFPCWAGSPFRTVTVTRWRGLKSPWMEKPLYSGSTEKSIFGESSMNRGSERMSGGTDVEKKIPLFSG